ncbi:SDR family oxidoreductase [Clostridiaceae bacterium 35-E11]
MGNDGYNFPKHTKFLVTGGAGFIGSNLVEKILHFGYKVKVLDNFSTGKEKNMKEFLCHPNFKLIKGDIRNIEDCQRACKSIDYVLHQAALGSVPWSINDPKTTNDINITGMLNMMIAAKDNQVQKLVYASSSAVYGDECSLLKKENRLGKPLSPYAITKLANEIYAKNFFEQYGLPTIGLRYFNVFGKRQDAHSVYAAVIPIFVQKLLKKESPTIYGDGAQSRDFTYIEDVIQANLKACLAGEEALGEVFNIAYGKSISLNELYAMLCKRLKVNIKPVYEQERDGDVKYSHADIAKAMEILGYCPKYDIDTGLALTIHWYKNNL